MLSAFFSASETAMSSVNKIRLRSLIKNGNKKAQKALEFTENYDKTISTILIGNNIVNIALASLSTVLFTGIFGEAGVGISTAVITLVVLIFGEITPKSIAKENSEKFALSATPVLAAFSFVLAPVNFLMIKWRGLVSKIVKSEDNPTMTEEELMYIVDEIQKEGTLNKQESDLIKSAIEFDDTTVDKILTHRIDMVAASVDSTPDELKEIIRTNGFSRVPIYKDNVDNIIGIIYAKDFYNQYFEDKNFNIIELCKEALFVPNTMKISTLLTLLQKAKSHIAVVADQYGGVMGIVTLEDVLEELVGEIWDETDDVVVPFTKIDDNAYIVNGDMDMDEIMSIFGLEYDDNEFRSSSIGGFISERLSRIPVEGDNVEYKNLYITVNKVDDRRVIEAIIEQRKEKKDNQD